jgi:NPCBM/NEW2 domain
LKSIWRSSKGLLGRTLRGILGALTPPLLVAVFVLLSGCKAEKASRPAPTLEGGKTTLGEIQVKSVTQEFGTPRLNASVGEKPLSIGKRGYETGFGTHASSRIEISFPSKYRTFTGSCGVDDEVQDHGSVVFKILDGEKVLFESRLMKGGMRAADFSVPVDGLTGLTLIVDDGGDGNHHDHSDWVDLRLK